MPLTDYERQVLLEEPPAPPVTEVLRSAVDQNPERAARVNTLARENNVPAPAVDVELDEMERRDKIRQMKVEDFGPAVTKYLSKPSNAAVSHDDVDNLRETERLLGTPGSLQRQVGDIGRGVRDVGAALLAGAPSFSSGVWGTLEQATDLLGYVTTKPLKDLGVTDTDLLKPVSDLFRAGRLNDAAVAAGIRPVASNSFAQAVYSGLESAGSNLLSMASGNPAYTLGLMVGSVEGAAYGTAKDQGLGVLESNIYSITQAGIEYFTEKIPVVQLFKDLQLDTPFRKVLVNQLASEIPGEQVATLLQDLSDWATLPDNADKPFSSYLEERPSAALQTLIATAVGTSVQTGAMHGLRKLTTDRRPEEDAVLRDTERLQSSKLSQETLDQVITLAQNSKTNQRAQDLYKEFLQGAGSDKSIFVPADIVEALDDIPESMASQLDGLGADVEIPMDTFMAEIAPDQALINKLRPHLKMGLDLMSADDIEKGADMTTRALLERAQANAKLKNEADEVWESVREQLVATGRLTEEESRLSADLYPAYATVAAERYGISVSEVFERMNLKVVGPKGEQAQAPAATDQVLEQDDTRVGRDEEYGIDLTLKPTQHGFEISRSDGTSSKFEVGTTGVHSGNYTLNLEGEFVPSGSIVVATTGATDPEVTAYRGTTEEKINAARLAADIQWARDVGDVQKAESLESELFDIVNGADSPNLLAQQPAPVDLGDTQIEERVKVRETGETVTIRQSAQKVYDQLAKRRAVVERIQGCLNAS